MNLQVNIKNKKAVVGVVGLGYVGLPLSVAFLKEGFQVIGVDFNQEKIKNINAGISPISDVTSQEISKYVKSGSFVATSDYSYLKKVHAVSVCVPTPLRKTREPDLSYIIEAAEEISKNLCKNHIIILESTTYPGTTEELVLPILEKSELKVGTDFFLAFSPERIDPGNQKYGLKNTPKIIGGVTSQCLELACLLYSSISDKVVPVSSTQSAEMVKLLENTFRAVNIALINEIAVMAKKLNLDVWEIIDAAGTKPFGFMKFYPGPGLGGHCIPIDPQFLSWKLKSLNYYTRFIQLAEEVNSSMPEVVVGRIIEALNSKEKSVKKSKILILGVSYKKNVGDYRESPALEIWKILSEKGAELQYVDSYVESFTIGDEIFHSSKLTKVKVEQYDCIVVLTDHDNVNYPALFEKSRLFVDTRNVLKGTKSNHLFKL